MLKNLPISYSFLNFPKILHAHALFLSNHLAISYSFINSFTFTGSVTIMSKMHTNYQETKLLMSYKDKEYSFILL